MAQSVEISNTPKWTSEDDVKRSLEQLRQKPLNAKAGLFGPGSMYWEVNRHSVVYYPGAVPAVMMQLVHPWVAVAIGEHSKIMTNPRQRARMTYSFLWSIIFGDMDTVAKRSLGLYKMHSRVTGSIAERAGVHEAGSAYAANEKNAMLWVHVTAFYGRIKLYEQVIRPLTTQQKDQYCQEAKWYAACFGIPEQMHPDTWAAVEHYVADMQKTDTLAATEPGLRVANFLKDTIPAPAREMFWAWVSLTVPQRTRELLGMPMDVPQTQKRARRFLSIVRAANKVLPAKLAYVPAWHEAMARIEGRDKPDWLIKQINLKIIGVPKLV